MLSRACLLLLICGSSWRRHDDARAAAQRDLFESALQISLSGIKVAEITFEMAFGLTALMQFVRTDVTVDKGVILIRGHLTAVG